MVLCLYYASLSVMLLFSVLFISDHMDAVLKVLNERYSTLLVILTKVDDSV